MLDPTMVLYHIQRAPAVYRGLSGRAMLFLSQVVWLSIVLGLMLVFICFSWRLMWALSLSIPLSIGAVVLLAGRFSRLLQQYPDGYWQQRYYQLLQQAGLIRPYIQHNGPWLVVYHEPL